MQTITAVMVEDIYGKDYTVPNTHEATGFRMPRVGDVYLGPNTMTAVMCERDKILGPRLILKPIERITFRKLPGSHMPYVGQYLEDGVDGLFKVTTSRLVRFGPQTVWVKE